MFGISNEKGFATLEVILMITVLGILAAVAVPRFSAITTSANTAKVHSDLSTLDTAIGLYQMDNGKAPKQISDLNTYIQDADKLEAPKGKVYINGTETDLSGSSYGITTVDSNSRATLGGNTSDKFTKNTSNAGSSSGS